MQSLQSIVRALSIAVVIVPTVLVGQRTERQQPGRPLNSLTIEAESLLGSAQTAQGQMSVQNMQGFGPGWGGGAQLLWNGARIGAQLALSFWTAVAGRYEIYLHFTRGPDFAIVHAGLEGAPVVTFNGCASSVGLEPALIGTRDLTSGLHEIRLDVMGKDVKSSGFNVGLDRIQLNPVGDREMSRNQATPAQPGQVVPDSGPPTIKLTIGECMDQNVGLRTKVLEMRSELAAANAEVSGLKTKLKEMTQPGGSLVHAYCASPNVSRNTAGAELHCGARFCEPVSGLCRDRCTRTTDCAMGYVCDVDLNQCEKRR